jgi:TM2 domain-containing membrane protein YozV
MSNDNTNPKSTAVAYLLWFFLGGFGAHRFYMGRTGSAFGMLGLCLGSTLLSPFLIGLLGFPVLFIWWLMDAFQINTWVNDAQMAIETQNYASPDDMSKAA